MKPVAIPEFSNGAGSILESPDEEGNNGTDKIEPFPTVLVITASGASLAIVGVGLLVYFKKRQHQDNLSSAISNSN